MIGKSILHYQIIKELGRGGMGVVYLAIDRKLNRQVAIKFLPTAVSADLDLQARFRTEARAAAALNHPNIATVHAFEESEDGTFIVMEYIDGQPINTYSEAWSLARTIGAVLEIADGLAAAHAHGVIHRDIKPDNILITKNNQVKILDFGLARLHDDVRKTRSGTVMGTLAYMSPEQIQGETVDHRSDIWALGILMYELLVGKRPFDEEHDQALVYAILNEPPNKLDRPDLPEELTALIREMLAKEVEQRMQSMTAVYDNLKAVSLSITAGESKTIEKSAFDNSGLTQIGDYKILRMLGEGGMGEVYLAEQEKPVRRQVALKIIKLGMDSKRIIARFEMERQALAMMNHPGIASVFEAGTTDKGRPYFVMEYVPGKPLSAFCDDERMSTDARLRLFADICRAVQHAHQKGVIHRDLKPSNILVARQDGQPIPKIIDFGIAKAIDTQLTDQSRLTAIGENVGTPAYMSPEQLGNNSEDIDTRSDIYALGVILYELLSGVLPFQLSDYQSRGAAFQNFLEETDPPTPSKRLQTLEKVRKTIAHNRRTEPEALLKILKGDPDWITMKAMERERERRYETANGPALDIERYLNDEPISARSPSNSYKLKKFARRNKRAVAAAAIAISGLIIGLVMATVGLWRATQAEMKAANEAEAARQVSEFLIEIFKVSDPTEAVGDTISARQLLDKSAGRIHQELSGEPAIQARLMSTMGKVYAELGLFQQGKALLDSALHKQTAFADSLDPELGNTLHNLGSLHYQLGEFDPALVMLEKSLRIFQERALHEKVVQNLRQLGNIWEEKEDLPKAEQYHRESVAHAEKTMGKDNLQFAESQSKLSFVLAYQGKYEAAEPLVREALAIARELVGDDHWLTSRIKNDLAWWLLDLNRNDEAVLLLNEVLASFKKIYGEAHSETAISMSNLASTYTALKRHDEAIALHEDAVAIFKKLYGEVHYDVATAMNNFGRSLVLKGDYLPAEKVLWEVVNIYETIYGKDTPKPAAAYTNLGRSMLARGEYITAEKNLKKSVALFEEMAGPTHPIISYPAYELAKLKNITGDHQTADEYYQRVVQLREAAYGSDNEEVIAARKAYSELLRKMGNSVKADSLIKINDALEE